MYSEVRVILRQVISLQKELSESEEWGADILNMKEGFWQFAMLTKTHLEWQLPRQEEILPDIMISVNLLPDLILILFILPHLLTGME